LKNYDETITLTQKS